MKPALGAAAGLGRWFVGVAVLPLYEVFHQLRRRRSATTVHKALPLSELPVQDMPWASARSNAVSAVCSRYAGACGTGCCGRAGQVVCGAAVLPISEFFQLRRRRSPTTMHRALPVCVWPVLGMKFGTAMRNTLWQCTPGVVKPTQNVLRQGWALFCRLLEVFS